MEFEFIISIVKLAGTFLRQFRMRTHTHIQLSGVSFTWKLLNQIRSYGRNETKYSLEITHVCTLLFKLFLHHTRCGFVIGDGFTSYKSIQSDLCNGMLKSVYALKVYFTIKAILNCIKAKLSFHSLKVRIFSLIFPTQTVRME